MGESSLSAAGGCFLHQDSPLNWLVRVPILALLVTNFGFLFRIMWVLITKLRSANTVETQRYRKAAKALLVLIPLLGLNYVLLIALPQTLEHLHPCLLSTQGLWVALFYCFLNSEVQNSIRHHIARWKTERGLMDRQIDRRDVSPTPTRSRNRLTRYGRSFFDGMGRKRESVCSEVTTTTTFITNGSHTPHHNFHHQKTSKQLLPLHQLPPSSNFPANNSNPMHLRQFRHSQPNLTQISSFTSNRCKADSPEGQGTTTNPSTTGVAGNSDYNITVPMYRPVSRSSNRSISPFDPPNIPMITPTNPDSPAIGHRDVSSNEVFLNVSFYGLKSPENENSDNIPTPTDVHLKDVQKPQVNNLSPLKFESNVPGTTVEEQHTSPSVHTRSQASPTSKNPINSGELRDGRTATVTGPFDSSLVDRDIVDSNQTAPLLTELS